MEKLLSKVVELNKRATQKNAERERELGVLQSELKTIEEIGESLKAMGIDVNIVLNDDRTGLTEETKATLNQLFKETEQKIIEESDRLEQLLDAIDNGDDEKIKALTGQESQVSKDKASEVDLSTLKDEVAEAVSDVELPDKLDKKSSLDELGKDEEVVVEEDVEEETVVEKKVTKKAKTSKVSEVEEEDIPPVGDDDISPLDEDDIPPVDEEDDDWEVVEAPVDDSDTPVIEDPTDDEEGNKAEEPTENPFARDKELTDLLADLDLELDF